MNATDRRLYIYIHAAAQKFVNKARSGKYSAVCLASEYLDMIPEYRYYYGICPETECNIYNRLPEAVQNAICKQWEEENA